LGDRDFTRLQELFEYYAQSMTEIQIAKLQQYQFFQFLKHHKLYHEKLDKTQATILFKKNVSKVHCLYFDDFCRVIYDLSKIKYPWELNRSVAVQQYVRDEIMSKGLWELQNKYEYVMDDLETEEVKAILR